MSDRTTAGPSATAEEAADVRLPEAARLFGARATRCRALAPGNQVADYLSWLASVADAQAAACREVPIAAVAAAVRWPVPLAAGTWPDGDLWHAALDLIVSRLSAVPAPRQTAEALARVRGMSAPHRGEIAATLLASPGPDLGDPGAAVLVAAALQACWSAMTALVPTPAPPAASGGRCPVCGSLPVAGLVLGDRSLRYLVCSLCSAEWRLTRLVCARCGSTDDLSYFAVEGAPAVKAEACGRCRRYLKQFYLEQAPAADAVADDVASLALDLLMADEGFARAGADPFLLIARPPG
jgi:FdhE protein